MDLMQIITYVLTAVIPAFLTYLGTKKSSNSKIKEVEITKNAEIKSLKMQHQHEIDKLNYEHQHVIEKLQYEHQLELDSKSNDMNTELTMKLINGEINIPKAIQSIEQLDKLSKQVEKLNSKKQMSDFVKKQ